jgi:hypothetical protein
MEALRLLAKCHGKALANATAAALVDVDVVLKQTRKGDLLK